MADVAVSVLTVDVEDAAHTFYDIETARTDYFHIDVMDGDFVENNNLEQMKDYATTISHISNIPMDVHLMVKKVEEIADDYMDLFPDRISFHIEVMKDENGKIDNDRVMNLINDLKDNGIKVGIAINPGTSIEDIKTFLPYIHQVIVMTVIPGKGGQELIPETLEKIKKLKEYLEKENIDIDIEADGGINDKTAEAVREANADILVSGSYVINSENRRETVNIIRG
jgi:ribulose-phosphate 3-epimerase